MIYDKSFDWKYCKKENKSNAHSGQHYCFLLHGISLDEVGIKFWACSNFGNFGVKPLSLHYFATGAG